MAILDGGSASVSPTTSVTLPITTEIIVTVQRQLQDVTGVSYPAEDLIPYMNLFFAELIGVVPSAYNVTEDIGLVAGAKQTLPEGTKKLLNVICNISGSVYVGPAPTILPRSTLDTLIPSWQLFTSSKTVLNVIRDEDDSYVFYTFPPQPVGTDQKLRVILSMLPTAIEDQSDDFPLEESYKLPCINYMLYLTLREETTIPNALNKANMCLEMFYKELGVEMTQQKK